MTTVAERMSRDVVRVDAGTTLVEATRLMTERCVSAALVLDGDELVGIVTERDVLRAFAAGTGSDAVVEAWMTPRPETVEPSESVDQAAVVMLHGGFRHLPVLEGRRVVGVVSMRDLLAPAVSDQAPRGV